MRHIAVCLFIIAMSLTCYAEKIESSSDDDVWTTLLEARFKLLERINQDIDEIENTWTNQTESIIIEIETINEEFTNIIEISQISKVHPTELTLLHGLLRQLYQKVIKLNTPLDNNLINLKTDLKDIHQLIQADALSKAEHNDNHEGCRLIYFLEQLDITQQRILHTEKQIETVIKPIKELKVNIKEFKTQFEKNMPELWKDYYLEKIGYILDAREWHALPTVMNSSKDTMNMRLKTQIPQTSSAWITMIIRMTIMSSLFLLLYPLKRYLNTKHSTIITTGALRLCKHSLPLIYLSIILYALTWSRDSLTYYPFIIIASIFMSYAQMSFAWDLYAFTNPKVQTRSELWPLLLPPTIGLILLFLDMPPLLVTSIWIVTLICTIIILLKQQHKEEHHLTLHYVLLYAYIPLLIVSSIISFLGWARLSIIICMAYTSISVFLQQVIGIISISNIILNKLEKKGMRKIQAGAYLSFIVPLLIILSMFIIILWFKSYPGSEYLLLNLKNFSFNIGNISFLFSNILMIVIIFFFTRAFVHVGKLFILTLHEQNAWFDNNIIMPVRVTFTYLSWMFFAIYALNTFGFSFKSLAFIAGGLSIGIGFGMQNLINNFISGLLIIFGKNLRENDVIEVGSVIGVVKKINVRSTTIETFDNATIFIPNGDILSVKIINWTHSGRMIRRTISVSVDYGTNIETVISLLKQVSKNTPEVLEYPEPTVHLKDFANHRLNFSLCVWITDISQTSIIETNITTAIEKTFRENNITIVC